MNNLFTFFVSMPWPLNLLSIGIIPIVFFINSLAPSAESEEAINTQEIARNYRLAAYQTDGQHGYRTQSNESQISHNSDSQQGKNTDSLVIVEWARDNFGEDIPYETAKSAYNRVISYGIAQPDTQFLTGWAKEIAKDPRKVIEYEEAMNAYEQALYYQHLQRSQRAAFGEDSLMMKEWVEEQFGDPDRIITPGDALRMSRRTAAYAKLRSIYTAEMMHFAEYAEYTTNLDEFGISMLPDKYYKYSVKILGQEKIEIRAEGNIDTDSYKDVIIIDETGQIKIIEDDLKNPARKKIDISSILGIGK